MRQYLWIFIVVLIPQFAGLILIDLQANIPTTERFLLIGLNAWFWIMLTSIWWRVKRLDSNGH